MDKIGYSIQETVERSGLGRTTVYELLKSGDLVSVKVGRRRLIPASALAEYFERLTAQQQTGARPT